jgi:CRISPR-associated protein Csb2
VGPGQLDRLDAEFARHRGVEPRTLPSRSQRYVTPGAVVADAEPVASGVFADGAAWIVFERVGGAHLMASRGVALARALRAALLEQAGHMNVDVPETLSGHRDGRPTDRPHLAVVPLPFVGSTHADSSIKGLALVPPTDLPAADRQLLVQLIAGLEQRVARNDVLTLAAAGLPASEYRRVADPSRHTTSPSNWCRPSLRFVTAVPIALDRNPGNLRSNADGTAHRAAIAAQRILAEACQRQGLPEPVRVEVGFGPLLPGAQPARAFSGRTKRDGLVRVRVHAEIEFPVRVRGPLLLGSARYFGGGLCMPVAERTVAGGHA